MISDILVPYNSSHLRNERYRAHMSEPIDAVLDALVEELRQNYHSLLLASVSYKLGTQALDGINDDASVTVALGVDISAEPLPVGELKQYRGVFPTFIAEVFHGRFVQFWQNVLDSIYRHYVDLHFSGERRLSELKRKTVVLDFRSEKAIPDQTREQLVQSYAFSSYSDRVRLVNAIRNPENNQQEHFDIVRENVTLRNCCQHNGGVLSMEALQKLGKAQITVLDDAGKEVILKAGDKIYLGIPQVNAFRRSLLLGSQAWRAR